MPGATRAEGTRGGGSRARGPRAEGPPATASRPTASRPKASRGADPGRGAGASSAPGTLYVVSTPVGNLGDITLRALDVLRDVAVVAAEDTRLTRRLWARHGITTPLLSFHAHSDERRRAELLARLDGGEDVALVTDAGTPLVSDPGESLVRAWVSRGGRVVPIPGASAVLAALVASAVPAPRWSFEGFLPRRGHERRERIARIAGDERASVLFESASRTAATLRDLAEACGEERAAAVCRELTKRHEEVRRGSLGELAAWAASGPVRGEVTIVVAGVATVPHAVASEELADAAAALEEARARVQALRSAGMSRSAAARQVAQETGLPRRDLFAPARPTRG